MRCGLLPKRVPLGIYGCKSASPNGTGAPPNRWAAASAECGFRFATVSPTIRAQGQPTASLDAARAEALERAQVIKHLLEREWAEIGRAYARQRRGFVATPRP
jgi:hypothetical protein